MPAEEPRLGFIKPQAEPRGYTQLWHHGGVAATTLNPAFARYGCYTLCELFVFAAIIANDCKEN